ncbi:MAG: hypothetical protein ACK4NQ_00035 [Fimbriimonadaceae bacterium]
MTLDAKLGAAIGFLTALTADLSSYRKAKLQDKDAKYDWTLAALRWVIGGLTGAGVGLVGSR